MAKEFVLTARLALKAPSQGSITTFANNLKKALAPYSIPISLKVDKGSARNIKGLTDALDRYSNAAKVATTNTATLNTAIANLGNSYTTIGTSVKTLTQNAVAANKSLAKQKNTTKGAANALEEFGQKAAFAVRRYTAFTIATAITFGFVRAIVEATKEAISFQRELIKVSQVTGYTTASLGGLTKQISSLSKTWGVSSRNLIEVSRILAQTGLSARETEVALTALAKTELAPTFTDIRRTTEGAIAMMNQFGITVNGLEAALGSINEVAGSFAVESDDLIAVIRRAGGVFAAASANIKNKGPQAQLQELIALFTAVRSSTRESAESIATGLRTIFTRIQRGTTLRFLDDLGIKLTDAQNKFVGPYEAFQRLSAALNDPSLQRTEILSKIVEQLGGFRQVGKLIPAIRNFGVAQEALAKAQEGQESVTADAIKAQEALAIQMTRVRESFLALVRDMADTVTFRGLVKTVLALTEGMIGLAGAIRPVMPLIVALAGLKSIKAVSPLIKGFFGELSGKRQQAAISAQQQNTSAVNTSTRATKQSSLSTKTALANVRAALTHHGSLLSANTNQITLNTKALQGLATQISQGLRATIVRQGPAGNRPRSHYSAEAQRYRGKRIGFSSGGSVSIVPGSGNSDTFPAMLHEGSYVLNKRSTKKVMGFAGGGVVPSLLTPGEAVFSPSATKNIGVGNLNRVNRFASGGPVPKFQSGGSIFDRGDRFFRNINKGFARLGQGLKSLSFHTSKAAQSSKRLNIALKNIPKQTSPLQRAMSADRDSASVQRRVRLHRARRAIGKRFSSSNVGLGLLLGSSIVGESISNIDRTSPVAGGIGGGLGGAGAGAGFGLLAGGPWGAAVGGLIAGLNGIVQGIHRANITRVMSDLASATQELEKSFEQLIENQDIRGYTSAYGRVSMLEEKRIRKQQQGGFYNIKRHGFSSSGFAGSLLGGPLGGTVLRRGVQKAGLRDFNLLELMGVDIEQIEPILQDLRASAVAREKGTQAAVVEQVKQGGRIGGLFGGSLAFQKQLALGPGAEGVIRTAFKAKGPEEVQKGLDDLEKVQKAIAGGDIGRARQEWDRLFPILYKHTEEAAKQIIAMEKAQLSLSKTMDLLTLRFTTISGVVKRVTSDIDLAAKQFGASTSFYRGEVGLGVAKTASSVIGNRRGHSRAEFAGTVTGLAGLFDSPAIDALAKFAIGAADLEKLLPRATAKALATSVETGAVEPDLPGKIQSILSQSVDPTVLQKFTDILDESTLGKRGGESGAGGTAKAIAKIDNVFKALKEPGRAAEEALLALAQGFDKAVDQVNRNITELGKAELASAALVRQISALAARQNLEMKEALGRTISHRDRTAGFFTGTIPGLSATATGMSLATMNPLAPMIGARTPLQMLQPAVAGAGAGMLANTAQADVLRRTYRTRISPRTMGGDSFRVAEDAQRKIKDLGNATLETKRELEALANDTSFASSKLKEIGDIRQRKAGLVGIGKDILTGGLTDQYRMQQEFSVFAQSRRAGRITTGREQEFFGAFDRLAPLLTEEQKSRITRETIVPSLPPALQQMFQQMEQEEAKTAAELKEFHAAQIEAAKQLKIFNDHFVKALSDNVGKPLNDFVTNVSAWSEFLDPMQANNIALGTNTAAINANTTAHGGAVPQAAAPPATTGGGTTTTTTTTATGGAKPAPAGAGPAPIGITAENLAILGQHFATFNTAVQTLQSLPLTLSVEINHQLNINFNGAEVFARMKDSLSIMVRDMALDMINDRINLDGSTKEGRPPKQLMPNDLRNV